MVLANIVVRPPARLSPNPNGIIEASNERIVPVHVGQYLGFMRFLANQAGLRRWEQFFQNQVLWASKRVSIF